MGIVFHDVEQRRAANIMKGDIFDVLRSDEEKDINKAQMFEDAEQLIDILHNEEKLF